MPEIARPRGRGPRGTGEPGSRPVRLRPIRIRGPQLTGRSMVILAMGLFLAVVLASPVQTYLNRRDSLAATQRQQQQLAQHVSALQQESAQWNDPAFVEREARIRLQYVRPGDTLYTVLNPDGTPRSSVRQPADSVARPGHGGTWNANLWTSVKDADAAP
ncbi:MAG: hypothetical protein QOK10_2923 [Pseudonocardiales bacterium]|jgi:cell division protein FtsB|nr:hypothetical protein [Pseudonocardiales bacterium]